jgi:hypothetical protein
MLSKLLLSLRSAFVCTLSLLATASLAQTTIHVGPGQTYTTIQSGIDAANTGDTVLVAPGTYFENTDFLGKAITVTSSGGAASTIIDGGQKAPAVVFNTSETRASILSGFTIQHGGVFDYTVFINGGIYLLNSSPTILNNILTQNNCWTIYSIESAPLIQGNEISATQDPDGNCSFGGGAGIYISGNFNGSSTSAMILGNTIENNVESGLEDAGGNGGAGVAVWGGSPIMMNNIIRNNASPGGSGGAINLQDGEGVAVVQNLIYGNSAGCGGGAFAIQTSTDPRTGISALIANNTIVGNVTTEPLAGFSECIAIAQIYPSPDTYGSSIPSVEIINNIISGSTTYPAVNCDWFDPPSEADQPTFENDILYNAGGPFFGSYCVDVSDEDNNIASDPQFVNASTNDYHLKSTSPAIDSGQNSVLQTFMTMTGLAWSKDFDGNPRVQDATGKGCIIDMGAYEYPGTVSQCGTTETLTSSLNPALAGQSVTFTAQLSAASGTPTGAIQFLDGTNLLSTQTVSGTGSATFSTNSLAVGSHTITANYQPTGTFGASTASLTQVIVGDTTSTALTCLPNPINIDNTAQLTAIVTSGGGSPTGTVTFLDGGALLALLNLQNGSAVYTTSSLSVGSHNITAAYTPTGPYATSSATCTEVVNALPTTSTLTVAPATSTYGSTVTLTATVSPATLPAPSTPTGVVTFYNGASAIGTGSLAGGVATLATGSLPGGSYNLTCMYGGSSIYSTSNCNSVPVIINAAPTVLTLSSSSNPASYLTPVTFTVRLTVNGQSAGAGMNLLFSLNGQTISLTTDATGSATYNVATLPPNSYPVTASFAGSNNLLVSSSSLTEVITPAASSISLNGTPNPGDQNQPITLVASVSPQTTPPPVVGTVTFYDGTTSIGSAALTANGTATITESFSTLGVHDITAMYGGDADFSGSTSAVFKETIVAPDFTISVSPGAATLYTGEVAAVTVSVTSLQGFNQPLALTCTGLPANATCSFSPASLTDGQGAAQLTIQTAAPHQAGAGSESGFVSGSTAVLGALTLLLLPGWKRRRRFLAGLSVVLLAIGVGMGMAGCGSPNPITGGTPPGTYQVAVTATAAGAGTALTHSAVVTLTVKSLF